MVLVEGRFNCLCELFDGTLVEKPKGFYESNLAMALGSVEQSVFPGHNNRTKEAMIQKAT